MEFLMRCAGRMKFSFMINIGFVASDITTDDLRCVALFIVRFFTRLFISRRAVA
jgi:hypothetical protein